MCASKGVTINEVHHVYELPESLKSQWAAPSHHGYRDVVNPATLLPLSRSASAPLSVEMMGGSALMPSFHRRRQAVSGTAERLPWRGGRGGLAPPDGPVGPQQAAPLAGFPVGGEAGLTMHQPVMPIVALCQRCQG